MKTQLALSLFVASLAGAPAASAADATPTAPAQTPTPPKLGPALEAGATVGVNLSTSKLGVAPGVGLDTGSAFRVGRGALGLHLRTQWQSYRKSGAINAVCTPGSSDPNDLTGAPCLKAGTMDYELDEQSIDLALRISYRFFADKAWTPYVGAGPKLFLLRTRTTSLGLDNTEYGRSFGLVGFGGAQLNVGPGHAFGELEYQRGGLNHIATGDAHLAGVALMLGYRASFAF